MLIDLRELLSGTKEDMMVSAELEMDQFHSTVATYDIISKEPVELTLTKTGKNKISLKGKSSLTLAIPCDRCLEVVPTKINLDFTRELDLNEEETDTEEDQEEQDYIDGYNLDVDKLVFGEILVEMPGKTLCKEDCKGLCFKCGANLNKTECGCDRESLDPRMSVFKDILNNFKEV